jgi:hypothetical protein
MTRRAMSHILIVDDVEDNRFYLSTLLTAHGFEVKAVHNGAMALAEARAQPPALVISDLLMPVMDGYTLLSHWKSDARLKGIPFIVYTATYVEPDDERLALDLGADAFILKPAEPDVFVARLREAISRAVTGPPAEVKPAHAEAHTLLKQYSETLIRKLEEKTIQLQEANRALQREVADRNDMARRLQESQEQYLLLLNSTAEGIYGLDVSGTCTFGNLAAARLLGLQHPSEMVGGMPHAEHHHSHADGTPYPRPECKIYRVLQTGEGVHADDEVFFRKDGSQFPVEYWAHPIRRGSAIVGAVVAFLDISERRNLEAQFLHSQKMEAVGRLAGGAAHDFNNVLQIILTCSELLAERLTDEPEESGLVREIRAAADRGASLTRQLLAFSRKQLLRPVLLNLNSVVNEFRELLQRMIGEDVRLDIRCEPNLHLIDADRGQLEQVLMNLAVNARDAMPHGGELAVSTSNIEVGPEPTEHAFLKAGQYAMLSIRDTGIGMDQATQSRMFEPFFTTKEAGKGTGLGLSTVYGIVRQSGGFIAVESEPNHGSTFRLYFPRAGGTLEPALPTRSPERSVSRPASILLVEDEGPLRRLISDALRAHGYRVLEAKDGKAGIELGERADVPLDLLLTDVILPDIGGLHVAQRLLARHPSIKVLYMSGYTDEYITHRGVVNDATMLLEKPFSIASLLATIRDTLEADPERPSPAGAGFA